MRLAPRAAAKPGTIGIAMASAVTAVPAAIGLTRLLGGAVPLLTHSSKAVNKARNAGLALWPPPRPRRTIRH